MRWRFRILAVDLAVASDEGAAVVPFAEEFAAFSVPPDGGGGAPDLDARLRLCDGAPRLEIGGRRLGLDDHPDPGRYLGVLLRRELAAALGDFHLLHASAAARDGAVLVLAGSPGAGKSTLMRELVGRGFGYYADDVSPLQRGTRLVHPFPLAARHRPNGAAGKKANLPAAALGFDPSAPPLLATAVVLLDKGAGDGGERRTVEVFLRPGKAGMAWDGLPETGAVRRSPVDPAAGRWRLDVAETPEAAAAVSRWLRDNRDRVWTAYCSPSAPPDFHRTPRLASIRPAEAARGLLREMTGGFGGELAAFPTRETPGEAWVRLAATLSGIPCYRLDVGRLEEELDLLLRLARPGPVPRDAPPGP